MITKYSELEGYVSVEKWHALSYLKFVLYSLLIKSHPIYKLKNFRIIVSGDFNWNGRSREHV